jgi:hypothetical protein
MKWKKSERYTPPFDGKRRVIKKFLWFPVETTYDDDVRWLETVQIEQVFRMEYDNHYWEDERFIKEEEPKSKGFGNFGLNCKGYD